MKFTLILIAISLLSYKSFAQVSYTDNGASWSTGSCASGIRQSPINIDTTKLNLENEDISITATGIDIASGTISNAANNYELKLETSNGQIAYRSIAEQSTWELAQFHFHAPSEHTIDGTQYALCLHNVFVKQGTSNQYMVLGYLWELDTNAPDDPFLTSLNLGSVGGSTAAVTNVPLSDLFSWSNGKQKYNYKGGLTTPGCTEAVEWMVIKDARKINQNQLSMFTRIWADNSTFAGGKGNNRIVQDLNRRSVNLVGHMSDSEDWDWVWPVVSVLIVLLVVSTALAVMMLVCYLYKFKQVIKNDNPKYDAHEVSQKDEDVQPEGQM